MSLSLRLKDLILRQTPIFQISSRISLSKNSSHIRFKIDVSDHFNQSRSDFPEAGKKKNILKFSVELMLSVKQLLCFYLHLNEPFPKN